ncbi:MAG TPA: GAF domain-containing sensor histidine kinase [Nocardioidaceae bacterium]|nr:GAF domain-containing sensor histidine kinase [Nocardioidaceae bacterium]
MQWCAPLRRPLTWLAVLGAAGLLVSAVAGVRTPGPFGVKQPQVWSLVGLLPGYLTGLALVGMRPRERVPRLLLAMYSAMALATALGAVSSRLLADGVPSWLWALVVCEYAADVAGPAAMGAMFLLFPDGVLRRRYEQGVLTAFAAAVVALPLLLMLTHRVLPAPEYAASRAALVGSPLWWLALTGLGPVVVAAYHVGTQLGLVGAVLLVVRHRTLPPRQRAQTHWLLLAAVAVLGDVVVVQLLTGFGLLPRSAVITTFYAVWVPALVFVPVAIWVALVRHRLFDVHLAVRRSLAYGAVSALIGAAFLGAATAFGVTAGRRLPLLATVLVTIAVVLALAPVRRRLDRWASARVYGERIGPAELLGSFGETLEHAYDLHELGPRAARMVVDGLGLTWARLCLVLPGSDVEELIGEAGEGEPGGLADLVIPLVDRDEVVGRIECGPPVRGRALGAEDRELLVTVARQTALAVRAAHFAAELAAQLAETRRHADALQESRRRLVRAQDTERRRLERDLHDGAQQEVVVVTTQLRLGLNQLGTDPEAARRTFEDARRTAAEILTGLRELARGIRPPVLADQGLLAAVEARTARVPVGVVLETEPGMRAARFDAEVESAAYFMVSEALTNVLKHAGADEVRVRLGVRGERLHLEVGDNGAGFVPADVTGTGLAGLSDRIGAVGGELYVRSRPGQGTALSAALPLTRTADV